MGIVFNLVCFPISGSCRKFCDNWKCMLFFLDRIRDVFANCFYISIE